MRSKLGACVAMIRRLSGEIREGYHRDEVERLRKMWVDAEGRGEWRIVKETVLGLLRINPRNEKYRAALIEVLYLTREYSEFESRAIDYLKIHREDFQIQLHYVYYQIANLGKYQSALRYIEKLPNVCVSDPRVRFLRDMCRLSLGQLEDLALADYEGLEATSFSANLPALLGFWYLRKGHVEAACALFGRYAQTKQPRVLMGLAEAFIRLNQLSKAEQLLEEGIRHYPGMPYCNFCYGQLLFRQKRYREAAMRLEIARTDNELRSESALLLGQCYRELGQNAKATMLLQEASNSEDARVCGAAQKLLGDN